MSDWLNRLNKKPSPTDRSAQAPEAKKEDEPPFYLDAISEVHIGLIATFGIKEGDDGDPAFREDIKSIAERFNEMNTTPRELTFSRKGE